MVREREKEREREREREQVEKYQIPFKVTCVTQVIYILLWVGVHRRPPCVVRKHLFSRTTGPILSILILLIY